MTTHYIKTFVIVTYMTTSIYFHGNNVHIETNKIQPFERLSDKLVFHMKLIKFAEALFISYEKTHLCKMFYL